MAKKKKNFFQKTWALAFVKGGIDAVFADAPLEVDVVKNPYKDRWFADPFILDVTDDKIFLLVEELRFAHPIGRIAKLTIDRKSMQIEKLDVLLELRKHLSFPNIMRRDGKVYVYPENCLSGALNIYEYDPVEEKLVAPKTICDDGVWDATMSDVTGKWQLFGSHQNDTIVDVYDWDDASQRFVHADQIESPLRDNRLAGQVFTYRDAVYLPTQDCTVRYGGGVCLKRMELGGEHIALTTTKTLTSPIKTYSEGLHTLNQYKGLVVIDLKGWRYPVARILYLAKQLLVGKK